MPERKKGEGSTVQTLSLPASHQEVTDNETLDDPVPDQFKVSDFLPDDDRLLAPLGDLAVVLDNDVLWFVLIRRRIGSISSPWTIPDRTEFEPLINEATQITLNNDCLAPFAWADPKRGNIALFANSRLALEQFREVVRSIDPKTSGYQYETYLRESVIQKYSVTIMPRTKLAPVLFKRNRYLKGSLRVVKIKFFTAEDQNSTGISRAGWRLFHLEADPDFLQSLQPFPEDHLFPLGVSGVIIRGGT